MLKHFSVLQSVELFKGIDAAELETMLNCMGAEIKKAAKGEIILLTGNNPQHIGVVLEGLLHIVREDYDGNRSLLAAITPGEIFAEALCCAGIIESPFTVLMRVDSTVMLLSFVRVLHTCPNSCSFHAKLIANMVELIAKKNLELQSRMEIVSMKSIRSKMIRYLESFRPLQGVEILIPFNREELADYLCVDRSALSHELAKMKKDGLIDYKKNRFLIKNTH